MKELTIKEWAQKSGKSELEITQAIVKILAIKAQVYGIDQHLRITCKAVKES